FGSYSGFPRINQASLPSISGPPLDQKTAKPSPSRDRKSTRLNSSHDQNSYAVFCLKKKLQKWASQTYEGARISVAIGVDCDPEPCLISTTHLHLFTLSLHDALPI